jgi:hypothetical protein
VGPGTGRGQWHHELGNGARLTLLQALEQRGVDDVVDLGTTPTWSMASLTQVREDGGTYEGLNRGWVRQRKGSREDSIMVWAPGRSTTTRDLVKFLAENFGLLTA